MSENGKPKEMDTFELSVKSIDTDRRLTGLEEDMKAIKPIVYDTASSVKQIERSVEKMTENSDKMRNYFLSGLISGAVGLAFFAVKALWGV